MLKISKGLLITTAALLLAGCGGNNNDTPKRESLKIASLPTKTLYNCGNNFDKEGLTLEYTDKDGNKTTVTDFTISEDKNLSCNQGSVKASYKGLTIDVDIEVAGILEGQLTCVGDSLTAGHKWPTESYPSFIKD